MSTLPLLQEESTSQFVNHINISTERSTEHIHSTNNLSFEPPSWHPKTAQHSTMSFRQLPVIGGVSQENQTTAPSRLLPWLSPDHCHSPTSRPHSLKRARPNSFDSNSSASTIHHSSPNSYFHPTQPPLEKVQPKQRDSGFVSSSSASDTSSLLSRMSRLSFEVKVCTADHALLEPGHSCNFCHYPVSQPKPLVYLAPEYIALLQADSR